jgi:hypothetical protein
MSHFSSSFDAGNWDIIRIETRIPLMNELLDQIGQALHGQQWQTALARDLDVADRTVRRWLAGDSAVPPGALKELRELCLKRSSELAELAARLET